MSELVIDYETYPIEKRPDYPPMPVGVAILDDQEPRYLAFGHPTGNNTTLESAIQALSWNINIADNVVAHNMPFEYDITHVHMGDQLPISKCHDTMIMQFLLNPFATKLSLKDLGVELLGEPKDAEDELQRYIFNHFNVAHKKEWKAYIHLCPGDVVAPYAIQDVILTKKLYDLLRTQIQERMEVAYRNEIDLIPILLQAEKEGVPVDSIRLNTDYLLLSQQLRAINSKIYAKVGYEFNIDSGDQLAQALDSIDMMSIWKYTPTGKRSTAKDSILEGCKDGDFKNLLLHRGKLTTCLETFMEPWSASGEYIHCEWRQTKKEGGGGARTGRLSSSPNFQNMPKEFDDLIKEFELPIMRSYIRPSTGYVLIDNDYIQQELKILAAYGSGELLQLYLNDPNYDVHELARTRINQMLGTDFKRKPIKNVVFATIYGAGLDKVALMLKCTRDLAKDVRNALRKAIPELEELNSEMRYRARTNTPFKTFGGRYYTVQPPSIVNGQMRTYEYKMLNHLIQASAGDMIKQSIRQYDKLKQHSKLIMTVHDENVFICPIEHMHTEIKLIKQAMESIEFPIPMLTECKISYKNLAELELYVECNNSMEPQQIT